MAETAREVLCRKWSIAILRFLADTSPKNYSQIEDKLETSSDVVVEHLQQLADLDLVTRSEESHKDVRYVITPKGEQVLDLIRQLDALLSDQ